MRHHAEVAELLAEAAENLSQEILCVLCVLCALSVEKFTGSDY
jgi:hypothetical protein